MKIYNDGRANKVPSPRAGMTTQDVSFLKDAKVSIMFELATSRLAALYATTPWGKEFAKEMVDEHTSSGNELDMIAKEAGVALPTGLPAAKQTIVAALQKANGTGFDEAYRKTQIDNHQSANATYDREIKMGHDSAVRNFAIKTLPAIRMHLKLAKLQKTMMGATKIQTNQ